MSKFARKPYDGSIRQSMEGSCLYSMWRKIRKHPHHKAWDYFPTFYKWAMDTGYEIGSVLCRADEDKPFNPRNCSWGCGAEKTTRNIPVGWAKEWNTAVNRIRAYYGMPLIGGKDGT